MCLLVDVREKDNNKKMLGKKSISGEFDLFLYASYICFPGDMSFNCIEKDLSRKLMSFVDALRVCVKDVGFLGEKKLIIYISVS